MEINLAWFPETGNNYPSAVITVSDAIDPDEILKINQREPSSDDGRALKYVTFHDGKTYVALPDGLTMAEAVEATSAFEKLFMASRGLTAVIRYGYTPTET